MIVILILISCSKDPSYTQERDYIAVMRYQAQGGVGSVSGVYVS